MNDKTLIQSNITWTGSRVFTANAEKSHSIQITGMGNLETFPIAWSPVHLFVSSIETCYFATVTAIFEKARINISSFTSRATGELTSADGKHKEISKVTIYIEAKLENPDDQEKAKTLIEKAENYCYVARSVKCPVALKITFQ